MDEICSGPPIPVIFVTGSPQQLAERKPDHLVVLKPFEAGDLLATVQVALGRADKAG